MPRFQQTLSRTPALVATLLIAAATMAWGQFPLPLPIPSPFPGKGGVPPPSTDPRLPRGSIEGEVVNVFGAGLYRAAVSLRDASRARMPIPGLERPVFTDQRGRFNLQAIPAGSYYLIAQCRDFTPATLPIEFKAGQNIKAFRVEMPDTSASIVDCE